MPGRRPWNRNIHYYDIVLDAVPAQCARALDAGCGDGLLASELASRCGEVIGIDRDGATLSRARASFVRSNLSFVAADIMSCEFNDGGFDFIASIATLHHLPLAPALNRFQRLLRPGGVLAIIGLYRLSAPSDFAYALAAMPVSWWLRLTKSYEDVAAPIRDPDETLAGIAQVATGILPGAVIERRLLFRYSLVWRKPSG